MRDLHPGCAAAGSSGRTRAAAPPVSPAKTGITIGAGRTAAHRVRTASCHASRGPASSDFTARELVQSIAHSRWLHGRADGPASLNMPSTEGADPYIAQVTPIKESDCIGDPSSSFFSENTQTAAPPHPALPIGRHYMIVRYLGATSISGAPSFDFGHFPEEYGAAPAPRHGVDQPECS